MASTSKLKKRKFEEKKNTDIMRMSDRDLGTSERMSDRDLGTSESGSIRTSLDGTEKQYEQTIQARCSPTRFVKLCTQLTDEFWKAVSEMGFSSLLEMSSCTIFRPLIGWLIKSFNIEDASLCVHGKTFILTPSSFEMVMGVKDGGEDFDPERSPEDVKRMQDAVKDGNATLSIKQLEDNLIGTESVDELFVARFVLFAVGTLLMPSTSVCVGTSMVGSITGLESVRKKNWATKSFACLVDAIHDFKKKRGAFVGGCVLFLQVFYLHHLQGHNQYIDRSILPIAAWTEKKSKNVVTWINEGSGYESEKIRMRETDDGCNKCQSMHSDMIDMRTEIKKLKLEIQELRQRIIVLEQSNNSDREVVARECGIKKCQLEIQELRQLVIGLQQSNNSDREVVVGECGIKKCQLEIQELRQLVIGLQQSNNSDREVVARECGIKKCELEIQELRQLVIGLQQSNNGDREVVAGESGIDKCELEIQELWHRVIVLEQSNNSDREVVAGEFGGSRIVDLRSSMVRILSGDREGVTGESGSDRIEKNPIVVLDDDESKGDSHRQSTGQSDVSLDNDSTAMYQNFVRSGGREVGPFKLKQPLSDFDANKIVMYIFDKNLDKGEIIVQFDNVQLSRVLLVDPLIAGEWGWEKVMDAYVGLLNGVVGMQHEIPENRESWFLPISLTWMANIRGLERLLDDVDYYNKKAAEWRKYLGNLAKCTKIVIPMFLVLEGLTAVVNLREENVVLWEYVPILPLLSEDAAIKTLRLLDHLLADDIKMAFPNGLSLQSFQIIHKKNPQLPDDEDDLWIYIMNHMRAVSKGLDNIPKFNPKEFLLEVYIELVQSQFNKVRSSVLKKCSSHFKSLEKATKRAGKRKIKF